MSLLKDIFNRVDNGEFAVRSVIGSLPIESTASPTKDRYQKIFESFLNNQKPCPDLK